MGLSQAAEPKSFVCEAADHGQDCRKPTLQVRQGRVHGSCIRGDAAQTWLTKRRDAAEAFFVMNLLLGVEQGSSQIPFDQFL